MKSNFLKAMFMTAASVMGSCGTGPEKTADKTYNLEKWEIKSDTLILYASDLESHAALVDTFTYLFQQNGADIQFGNAQLKTPTHSEYAADKDGHHYKEFSIFFGRHNQTAENHFVAEYFTLNKEFYNGIHAQKIIERGMRGPDYEGYRQVLEIIKQPNIKKEPLHVR